MSSAIKVLALSQRFTTIAFNSFKNTAPISAVCPDLVAVHVMYWTVFITWQGSWEGRQSQDTTAR